MENENFFFRIMRENFKKYNITYSNGQEVEDLFYIDVCERFLHGLSYCRRQDGNYNVIDNTGRIKFDAWFEELNVYRIRNSYLFELKLIKNYDGEIRILCDDYHMEDLKSNIKLMQYSNAHTGFIEHTYIIFKDSHDIPRICNPLIKHYIDLDINIREISWDGHFLYVRRSCMSSEDKSMNIFNIDTKQYLFKEWFEEIEFFPEIPNSLEKKGHFLVRKNFEKYNLISSANPKKYILKEDSRNIIFNEEKNRFYIEHSKDKKLDVFDRNTGKIRKKFWIF